MKQPGNDLRDPLAIIDIGSNSARLAIYHRETSGQLRILGSARQSLRLVRDVDKNGRLSVEAITATLKAMADFRSIIRAYGARRTVAVATSAMRDADNAMDLIDRARSELGLRIERIDAIREAYYGALGGIRALPVDHGIAFDLGGGSVQIVQFHDRRLGRSYSLPLGSLRLSQSFIRHDPPTKREVRGLRAYVQRALDETMIPRLKSKEYLIGVGGTIRNLAKVDARLRRYPIARIHGYALSRERLRAIVDLLCRNPIRSKKSLPGLSREREDSFVGGALAIEALMDAVGGREIVVSGQGLREGLVCALAKEALPSPKKVQDAAVDSLARRFSAWNPEWAKRRKAIASRLLDFLSPETDAEIRTAVEQAAILLDIGRSVDFFDRYAHAASMVLNTELDGFSHHHIVLLSAIIANAGDESAGLHTHPLLLKDVADVEIKRAAVLLKLADDMLQRWPRRLPIAVECQVGRREVRITGYGFEGWTLRGIGSRFERLFNRRLIVRSIADQA